MMLPKAGGSLAHYGVKGMKWGVRRNRPVERTKVRAQAVPGRRLKTTGGTGQKAHPDAVRAAVNKQKAKASTTDSLSDKELKALVNRMNMEQQYSNLAPKSKKKKTAMFVAGFMTGVGKQQATNAANSVAAAQVQAALKAKGLV